MIRKLPELPVDRDSQPIRDANVARRMIADQFPSVDVVASCGSIGKWDVMYGDYVIGSFSTKQEAHECMTGVRYWHQSARFDWEIA